MTGESADSPLPAEDEKPAAKADWAPILLFAVHAAFVAALTLFDLSSNDNEYLMMFALGACLTAYAVCAVWAVWAPAAKIWRIPMAIAAFVCLGACGPRGNDDVPLMLIFGTVVFVVFVSVAVAARWLFGLRLSKQAKGDLGAEAQASERFGTRYLLTLTAIVAGVMTFARLLIGDSLNGSVVDSIVQQIDRIVFTCCPLAFLVTPAILAFVLPLCHRPQWLILAITTSLLVVGCSYAALWAAMAWVSVGQHMYKLWALLATVSGGAVLSSLVSAVVLRCGGYRVTRH